MNLIHNILNALIVLCGLFGSPEILALVPPETAVAIASGAAAAKLFLNGLRDGVKGFYAAQPVIK